MKRVRVLKAYNRHSKGAVLNLNSMVADALVRRGFVELVDEPQVVAADLAAEREVAALAGREAAVVATGKRKGRRK